MSPLAAAVLGTVSAAVLLAEPAAWAQGAQNMYLKIRNESPEPVTVRVLHSDGQLQKQETIKGGDTHRFKFEWCANCCGNDKQRRFDVTAASAVRATGRLVMTTESVPTTPIGTRMCVENNTMTARDEDLSDAWLFTEAIEDNHRTAVLIVRKKSP